MIKETEFLLREWAKWARHSALPNIGYPNLSLGNRKTSLVPMISDDEAMAIDALLSKLQTKDAEMGDAIVCYYLQGENYSHVSRCLSINNRRAEQLVKSAVSWLDGVMEGAALTG